MIYVNRILVYVVDVVVREAPERVVGMSKLSSERASAEHLTCRRGDGGRLLILCLSSCGFYGADLLP